VRHEQPLEGHQRTILVLTSESANLIEVDVTTETYHVARKYMIRLERDDLVDPERLAALAKVAAMKPDEFKARYQHVVAGPAALEVSRD